MAGREDRVVRARTVRPGSYLGHYEILELLAEGGMAEVFLARDSHVGKLVVLKRGFVKMMEQQELAAMFYDEARLASMFDHPNIVKAHDVRAAASEHYYVMEFLDGLDAQQVLHRSASTGNPIPMPVSVNLMTRLADALHYAHELCDDSGKPMNIVHRDISPANVRLTFDGRVKLLDFGVASAALEERSVTRIGQVKGKLTYMAPEQLAGSYDRRSDVFSLGVVLYELTTLTRFFGKSRLSVTDRLSFKGPVRPRHLYPSYPDGLEAIVLKATAARPDDRYQDAAEFGRALVDFVVEAGMILSDEVLADFIAELVKVEREPRLASGTRPEPARDKSDVVAKHERDASPPPAGVDAVDDDHPEAVYSRATSVLETLGADLEDAEFTDPVPSSVFDPDSEDPDEVPEAAEETRLPTLDEISQRRRQRMRTTSDSSAVSEVPKLDNKKSRRLYWRLAITLTLAVAAAIAVAELLIQL